jgi:hypothetical protein
LPAWQGSCLGDIDPPRFLDGRASRFVPSAQKTRHFRIFLVAERGNGRNIDGIHSTGRHILSLPVVIPQPSFQREPIMAMDISSAVNGVVSDPNNNAPTTGKANDPVAVRRAEEAAAALKAEQRRLEEIQADETRAENARQERNRREQASRNATGEIIGTTVNSVA